MIVAAIPVKRLADAKSRLSSRLDPSERAALVMRLLGRTVRALLDSGVVTRVAVTTPERNLGHQLGIEVLPDWGSLNASLSGAVGWALGAGATRLLILPGDLPLITPEDILALVNESDITRGVGIAPTRDGGTGALLLTPPDIIQPSFGPDSYRLHLELADQAEAPVHVVKREAFSMDLDTAEDLEGLGPRTVV